jgi:sugar phosphate isomerase/epimerase
MKLSTTTGVLDDRFGYTGAIKMIAAAGFDAIDFSMFTLPDEYFGKENRAAFTKKLRARAKDAGVCFNQAHAPYPSLLCDEGDAKRREMTRTAIIAAAELGAKVIVVHPAKYLPYATSAEELFEINMEMYASLIPLAKESGIKIGVENMFTRDRATNIISDAPCSRPEEFCRYVDELNSPHVTACLDIGHAHLVGQTPDGMIRALGSRIEALHVHDNDLVHDLHTLPFVGKIDWDAVTDALAEIAYGGDFTFEADSFIDTLPPELIPDALAFMAKVGRNLVAKIERKA